MLLTGHEYPGEAVTGQQPCEGLEIQDCARQAEAWREAPVKRAADAGGISDTPAKAGCKGGALLKQARCLGKAHGHAERVRTQGNWP